MGKIRFYSFMLLLIVGGAAIMFVSINESKNMKKDPIDLYDSSVDWDDIEVGDHIEMDVPIVIGCYARLENEKTGEDSQRFYSMPLYSEETGEVLNFIGIHLNDKSLYSQYEGITDDIDAWLESPDLQLPSVQTVHIDGVVKQMTEEQYDFHEEYLVEDWGFDEDLVKDSKYQLYIDPAEKHNTALTLIGAAALLIGIGGIAISVVKRR